jgi:pyruvate/2-oxoglutarate dehydrogenase complex dihydrolipoamide acyltransferase (E2) component
MKQQEVFKKIGIIIKELNDQYEYLVENENEMNDLEMELFVANAHFLADHSEVLRKLNLNKPEPKALPAPQEKYFEPVVQQSPPPVEAAPVKEEKPEPPVVREIPQTSITENPVPHIDLRGDDTGADYSYMRQEPEIIRHELNLDDISNHEEEGPAVDEPHYPINQIIETPKTEAPKVELVQPVPEPVKTEIKIPEEKEEPLTINQRIMAQMNANNNRNAEHVSTQPITDLKQAITLNDKLLYIKDLFNGYNLAYSEAIDILNRFNSFDEADKFLHSSYAAKNNWESKQSTVDKFYDLLKRRYS